MLFFQSLCDVFELMPQLIVGEHHDLRNLQLCYGIEVLFVGLDHIQKPSRQLHGAIGVVGHGVVPFEALQVLLGLIPLFLQEDPIGPYGLEVRSVDSMLLRTSSLCLAERDRVHRLVRKVLL